MRYCISEIRMYMAIILKVLQCLTHCKLQYISFVLPATTKKTMFIRSQIVVLDREIKTKQFVFGPPMK